MPLRYLIFVFITILLFNCNSKSSLAIVGYSKDFVIDGFNTDAFDNYIKGDSLLIFSKMDNNPLEILAIFKKDTCISQIMNIYCSPCAEKILDDILSDNKFKFHAVDEVNYISLSKQGVVLRLKDKPTPQGNCNQVLISDTSK